MDGLPTLASSVYIAASLVIASAGCAELKPQPAPLPVELYDSPVLASGSSEAAPPKKLPPVDNRSEDQETAVADSSDDSDSSRQSVSSSEAETTEKTAPALASIQQTETKPASTSKSQNTERRPSPSSSGSNNTRAGANSDAARYVAAIYELNDVAMPNQAHTKIPAMYRHCREEDAIFQSHEPKPGDLVFFHNVADTNGDGRNNDWYTLVGLVERIDSSGTVQFLAYRDGQVRSLSMNLEQPDASRAGGSTVNSRLRAEHPDDPPFTQHLAGQLFAGYCSLLGERSELLVVDNWEPGMELEKP